MENKINFKRSLLAANLAQAAYWIEGESSIRTKELGLTKSKLVSKKGAEVLITQSKTELWFAFRGTEPTKFNDVMADLKVIKHTAKAGGKVHGGFQDEVNEIWSECQLELDKNDNLKNPKEVYMCGHSLGAAMATIAASRYKNTKELYTFGSPRVGGKKFTDTLCTPHYRFVNNNDIVTRVPPTLLRFSHDGTEIYFNAYGLIRAHSGWQGVKDTFRGLWANWKSGVFFDSFSDHGMVNYISCIENECKLEDSKGE